MQGVTTLIQQIKYCRVLRPVHSEFTRGFIETNRLFIFIVTYLALKTLTQMSALVFLYDQTALAYSVCRWLQGGPPQPYLVEIGFGVTVVFKTHLIYNEYDLCCQQKLR